MAEPINRRGRAIPERQNRELKTVWKDDPLHQVRDCSNAREQKCRRTGRSAD